MSWIAEAQAAATNKVRAELEKPLPTDENDCGAEECFDPWRLFPSLYGSYSKEFDDMALHVLRNLNLGRLDRWDAQEPEQFPHHIFREMLCTADLCDYGTSPRVCFATGDFRDVLPALIEKWEGYSAVQWQETTP